MNKKYSRTPHLITSKGATNDDKIAESADSLLNVPVVLLEKIDGENNGHTNKGVYARSHVDFTISPWASYARQLNSIIRSSISENMTIFVENVEAIHSIEYTNLFSYFYVIAVRDEDKYLSWKEVEEYAFLLDLPTAPVLYSGIFKTEAELYAKVDSIMKNSSSKLGGEMEGIVIRKAEEFHEDDFEKSVMKWVRADHIKTDCHWHKNWRRAKLNYK